MFLKDMAPTQATLDDLARRPGVWVVGASPDDDTGHYFPGWSHGASTIIADGCYVWQILPPGGTTR
jgi:hypothetical protein